MAAGSSVGMGDGMTDSLLSRLEALTEPSREIDAEVALANGWRKNPGGLCWLQPDGRLYDFPPRYTASIDAALKLALPFDGKGRGLWIKLNEFAGSHGSGKSCWHAELYGIDNEQEFKYWGMHPLPAVALLIAIMKAREETILPVPSSEDKP